MGIINNLPSDPVNVYTKEVVDGIVEGLTEDIGQNKTDISKVDEKIDDLKAQGIQQTPLFAESVEWLETNGDQTKVYVLPDGYSYAYTGGAWTNSGCLFTSFDTLEKVIAATCDTEIVEGGNYNLLKLSEVSYSSRLQNDAEGIVASTAANFVTGWIPVTSGKFYCMSLLVDGARVTTFDDVNPVFYRMNGKKTDGTIVVYGLFSSAGFPLASARKSVVSIPDDIVGIQMHCNASQASSDLSDASKLGAFETMIVEGDSVSDAYDKTMTLPYLDGDVEVPSEYAYTLKSDNAKADKISNSPYFRDVNFGVIPSSYYHGVAGNYENSAFGWTTQYTDFIAMWKDLIADYSSYVTEKELGTASDGQPIYLYDFKPAQIDNADKPIPKIIIIAGQHGGETCNIFGLYYFVKDLLSSWASSPALEFLRHHVELMIVPVTNTYGFDNRSYKNANGVNLNRNYDSNWMFVEDTTSLQYSGADPFDQPETQIIRDLLLSNADAVLVVDAHVNGGGVVSEYSDINYYGISPSTDVYFNRMISAIAHNLTAISANFNLDYNLGQPDAMLGFLNRNEGTGILRNWGRDQNLVTVLVEGFGGFPGGTAYAPEVFKANEEIIVNFLITAMHYLGK